MPSATLQSRISAFESLGPGGEASSSSSSTMTSIPRKSQFNGSLLETSFSPSITPRPSPSPSPPNLGHKTSFIDLKDWNIIEDGSSPPRTNGSKPFSTSTNGNGNGNGNVYSQWTTDTKPFTAPLINLETSPKPKSLLSSKKKPPPLPPRKPSMSSLKSAASFASPSSSNGTTSFSPSHQSDSLKVKPMHTYPPPKIDQSHPRNIPGHAPASSISSFHSVSLSSDTDPSTPGSVTNFIATYPVDQDREREFSMKSTSSEADSVSLGESYEEVSFSALASPATEGSITRDWERMLGRVPPKIPRRPASSPSSITPRPSSKPPPLSLPSQSSASASASYLLRPPISSVASSPAALTKRRLPPPPPSRSSDRSSIHSTATSRSTSSTYSKIDHPWSLTTPQAKTKRPTPVPPAARQRYECVFNANIVQRRRAEKKKAKDKPALLTPAEVRGATRRAAGWRGLSVDLITSGPDTDASLSSKEAEADVDEAVGNSDRLEGCFVKSIWVKSKLGREKLNDIWNECDPDKTGALDRDGFVSGMWRIDEELRRARTNAVKSASSSSLGSLRGRNGHKLPSHNKPKLILR